MSIATSLTPGELTAKAPVRRRLLGELARTRLSGVILITLLLLLWEVSAARGWIVSDNWPRFSAVLVAAYRGLLSGELAEILGATLYRMLAGYAVGCLLGVLFGLLLGSNRILDWTIRPLIEIQRTLPSPAIIPPLILFLGVDDTLKIFIIMLAVFPPVFVNTYGGVRGLDETLLLTAKTFGPQPVRHIAQDHAARDTSGDDRRHAHRAFAGADHGGHWRDDFRRKRRRQLPYVDAVRHARGFHVRRCDLPGRCGLCAEPGVSPVRACRAALAPLDADGVSSSLIRHVVPPARLQPSALSSDHHRHDIGVDAFLTILNVHHAHDARRLAMMTHLGLHHASSTHNAPISYERMMIGTGGTG